MVQKKKEKLGSKSNRIRNDSSIFTAEIEAIKSTLQYIEIRLSHSQNKNCLISCDSKSVLESIGSQYTKITLIINVLDMLQELRMAGACIKFCWIPNHVGTKGNEKADEVEKKLKKMTDWLHLIKSHIKISLQR